MQLAYQLRGYPSQDEDGQYCTAPKQLEPLMLTQLLATDFSEVECRRAEAFNADATRLLQTGDPLTFVVRTIDAEASASIGDVEVGRVEWVPPTLMIDRIEVHPGLRRRGIATALWHAVHAAGIDLTHSGERTVDGAAWAAAVSGHTAGHFESCDDCYSPIW